MMETKSILLSRILKVALISFGIKAIYSIVLAGPANLLVYYIKKLTGVDVYDFPKKFTPFKYNDDIQKEST